MSTISILTKLNLSVPDLVSSLEHGGTGGHGVRVGKRAPLARLRIPLARLVVGTARGVVLGNLKSIHTRSTFSMAIWV